MEIKQIILIVEVETGLTLSAMIDDTKSLGYDAKCIIAMMAHEDGHSDKKPLADLLGVERTTIYTYINRADRILSTWPGMSGYDRVFKLLYQACNNRRVWLEERPNITFIRNNHV